MVERRAGMEREREREKQRAIGESGSAMWRVVAGFALNLGRGGANGG